MKIEWRDSELMIRENNERQYKFCQIIMPAYQNGSRIYGKLQISDNINEIKAIQKIELSTNNPIIINGVFRIYFLDRNPENVGDGQALTINDIDYIDSFDVSLYISHPQLSNGARGMGEPTLGSAVYAKPVKDTNYVYYAIETRASYQAIPEQKFKFRAAIEFND